MVGLQTLDLAIGVRVPASQPNGIKQLRAAQKLSSPVLCAYSVPAEIFRLYCVPVFVNSICSNLSEAPCCMSGMACEYVSIVRVIEA
jgi:hypothetical protein